jgi:hypothetical protein
MRATILFRLSLMFFLLAAFFGFQIINLLVSLQYETDGSNACISTITQANLCESIMHCKVVSIGGSVAGIFFLVWSARKEHHP